MTKPFDRVLKPTSTLLQRLTTPPTSSDVLSSVFDNAYKFDFLHDVADVAHESLPLIGTTDSKLPPVLDHLTSENTSSTHDHGHIDDDNLSKVLDTLPRIPSFRAHQRDIVRTSNNDPTGKLSCLQEENIYLPSSNA